MTEFNKNPEPKMSNERVKKLARDLVTNLVFMSDKCRRTEDIPLVFFVLYFVEPGFGKKCLEEGIVHFYEYFSEALPVGVNGYPTFPSLHSINLTDYERVIQEEIKMRKALE